MVATVLPYPGTPSSFEFPGGQAVRNLINRAVSGAEQYASHAGAGAALTKGAVADLIARLAGSYLYDKAFGALLRDDAFMDMMMRCAQSPEIYGFVKLSSCAGTNGATHVGGGLGFSCSTPGTYESAVDEAAFAGFMNATTAESYANTPPYYEFFTVEIGPLAFGSQYFRFVDLFGRNPAIPAEDAPFINPLIPAYVLPEGAPNSIPAWTGLPLPVTQVDVAGSAAPIPRPLWIPTWWYPPAVGGEGSSGAEPQNWPKPVTQVSPVSVGLSASGVDRKPFPQERERKVKTAAGSKIIRAVDKLVERIDNVRGAISEFEDMLDYVYYALPRSIIQQDMRDANKYDDDGSKGGGKVGVRRKLDTLYHHYKDIDVGKFLDNWVKGDLSDTLTALGGQALDSILHDVGALSNSYAARRVQRYLMNAVTMRAGDAFGD